ncbi:MAG: sialate O-acetylesterase [Dehalococcoidia bacterium]
MPFRRTTNATQFRARVRSASSVLLGSDDALFLPDVSSRKFIAGVCMSLRHAETSARQKLASGRSDPIVSADAVEITVGKCRHTFHQPLQLDLTGNAIEWDVSYCSIDDIPAFERFIVDMPSDLEWHYQPPLVGDLDENGWTVTRDDVGSIICRDFRPENVVGSYAIYVPQRGTVTDRRTGKLLVDWATGKFGHIYRPEMIAANGQRTWCEMRLEGHELLIEMPIAWCRKHPGPWMLDPIVGYDTKGASGSDPSPNYVWCYGPYAAGGDGTVDKIYMCTADAEEVTCGIYADSSGSVGSLIDDTDGAVPSGTGGGTDPATWSYWTCDSGAAVTNTTAYWLAQNHSTSSLAMRMDTNAAFDGKYKSSAYSSGALPSTIASPTTYADKIFSIYGNIATAPDATITLTSPVAYQCIQRDGSDQAAISISGTYTGTPEAIEASWDGGAYATIDAAPADGTFSGSLADQAAGQGALVVRFTDDTDVTDTSDYIGIGDIFLVVGDSIAEGRGQLQTHDHATLKPSVFNQNDTWTEANDPCDSNTSLGSHWPILAKHLMDEIELPVAFVTTGTGSTDVAGNTQWVQGNSAYVEMQAQAAACGTSFRAILAHWGPNAVSSSLSQATYNAALDEWISDVQADVQADINLYLGIFGEVTTVSGVRDTLRYAIMEAWADNASIGYGPNLIEQDYIDNVHPTTDTHLLVVGNRWAAALITQLYGGSGGRGPRATSVTTSGATAVIAVNEDLEAAKSGYTAGAWSLTDGSGTRTITSVTRTATREITVTVSGADLAGAVTVVFASESTSVGATVPTKLYTLPDTSTVSLPLEPFVRKNGISASAVCTGTNATVAAAATVRVAAAGVAAGTNGTAVAAAKVAVSAAAVCVGTNATVAAAATVVSPGIHATAICSGTNATVVVAATVRVAATSASVGGNAVTASAATVAIVASAVCVGTNATVVARLGESAATYKPIMFMVC